MSDRYILLAPHPHADCIGTIDPSRTVRGMVLVRFLQCEHNTEGAFAKPEDMMKLPAPRRRRGKW